MTQAWNAPRACWEEQSPESNGRRPLKKLSAETKWGIRRPTGCFSSSSLSRRRDALRHQLAQTGAVVDLDARRISPAHEDRALLPSLGRSRLSSPATLRQPGGRTAGVFTKPLAPLLDRAEGSTQRRLVLRWLLPSLVGAEDDRPAVVRELT